MPAVPLMSFMLAMLVTASGTSTPVRGHAGLEVSAMTFNIRYGTARDGEHAWPNRREGVIDFIGASDADFLGLQESLAFQTEEIRKGVGSTYGMIVRTRDRTDGSGEANPILYKKQRWTLDEQRHGTFWLSEQPEEPGSKSWESSLPRIATWGRFIEKESGRVVWIVNTHFDHRSAKAREEGAKLVARRIGDTVPEGEPIIVLGDLNAREGSAPLKALEAGGGEHPVHLVDTFRVLHPDETANCTFNGWGPGVDGRKIDYVLVPEGTRVIEARIVRKQIESGAISDHWPVRATMVFTAPE